MTMSRREWLAAASCVPLMGLIARPALARSSEAAAIAAPDALPTTLPDRESFLQDDRVYLNSGSQHPMSLGARDAVARYFASRTRAPGTEEYHLDSEGPIRKFAKLVNADEDEITYVQSTTAGEQMVLKALGLPDEKAHIVTDTLHFFGSLPLYEEMERQGTRVTWVRERDGRIELDDIEAAVKGGATLVALSLVSTINGFEHDLKAVCDIAHAAGAYVYADIIHAAGCVPVDLHASGVDFAASASYKWLMGDFGLGFLYVRKDVQDKLKRINFGYYGMSAFRPHVYPFDEPGDTIADYAFQQSAAGWFALGTHSHAVIAQLDHSLDYILGVGVEAIQAHAQTLTDYLKQELPKRGYTLYTPMESRTPMVTCVYENARAALSPKFKEAGISLSVSQNRFRASMSVFNTMDDMDRLLAALDA
ncbi:MAG: aminotransferase class V-fold PLP-dependent enzyme [Alphaproteobacteria bacterium]|nr:MAG: aminotransferase class V-fold PLP-dependent enzyme [Alphaproteobacteria bacterium]